jgi:hypothetical protein
MKAKSAKSLVSQSRQSLMMKKIDENLLNLPHSSLVKISDSITKISSDMAEMSGLAGIIGRAVLERAKLMRESLNVEVKPKAKAITPKKISLKPKKMAATGKKKAAKKVLSKSLKTSSKNKSK